MSKHFIAMAGLHGYMPNYLCCHASYENAVYDLAQLHELGKNRTRELDRDGCLELNLRKDGNEYCEIVECDCDHPEDHND